MANKKEQPRRRSLNDRLDAELASAESIPVAGITNEQQQPSSSEQNQQQETVQPEQGRVQPSTAAPEANPTRNATVKASPDFPTKKATTIMPKEVFAALQRYCIDTETPKHRALYLFIIDGLHAKHVITDDDYQRFRDKASQLTTTYEKK
jgi:hypothetical protein